MYWEEEKTLIASDLHIGKTGHFRKAGIAVPQAVFKEDMQRLIASLQFFKPGHLLIVGDLFHSVANKELNLFKKWREDMPDLQVTLVKGNHDILKEEWYRDAGIVVQMDGLLSKGICFTHDNSYNTTSIAGTGQIHYTISGHIHPGVAIRGAGRQSLNLPCFYFGETFAVLPAFSRFTGTALIKPNTGDVVFAIVNQTVIRVR